MVDTIDYRTQLNEILERATEEKCFSLETVKRINELRITLDGSLAQIESQKKLIEQRDAMIAATQKENDSLRRENERLIALDLKQNDIEMRAKILEIKELKATGERDLAVDLFKTVFANTVLKKSICRSVPAHNGPDGRWVDTENEYKDETTKEE